nr:MAG TPA: hypothetical protein [Caudoviricetes sp.]
MKTELAKRAIKALEDLEEGRAKAGRTVLDVAAAIQRVVEMSKEEVDANGK